LTVPPNIAMIASLNIRYIAISTRLDTIINTTELPTLFLADFVSSFPRLKLTKAQHPSPIITAIASAITVSGNTTVFAALPYEPRYVAFAMNIWSTML